MKKLHCVICGEESGRINYVCGECMAKANIPRSTTEAIEEINSALEILDISANTDANIGEVIRNLNKAKKKIE